MRSAFVRSSLAALAVAALACAPTTHVVAAWKDPNLVVIERPLVVFQHPSEALRRSVEDALAERIPGAVPAYEVIATDEIFDVEGVQRKVREAHFDTVLIARLVDVREEVEVVPGQPYFHPPYEPLWGAWAGGWSRIDEPAYLETTTIVTLLSLVYELTPTGDGELVWASRSETFDPSSFESLAKSVARSAVKEMTKEGVVVAAREQE